MRRVPDGVLATLVGLPFVLGLAAAPAPPEADVVFTFRDPEVVESSGLVARDGLVLTVNDSGDTGRVFAVDPATGETVGVTRWSPDPRDVEALAPAGPGEVWVADIGDNRAVRDSVEVLRVPVGRGERTVEPERFELVYPDGPADAETLLAEPGTGRLVVITKGLFGGAVLRAPARLDPDRPNRLEEVGSALAIATDGSFLPDGRHLLVRNYARASVLTWPGLESVGAFDLPPQDQGEGLAVDEDGRVLISTEGAFSEVLRVRLPREVREAISAGAAPAPGAGPSGSGEPSAAPDPDDEAVSEPDWSDRPGWPWFLGGWLGIAVLVLLLRWLWRRPGG